METGIKVFLLILSSQHCTPTWDIFQQIPDRIPPLIPVGPLIYRPEQQQSKIPVYRPLSRVISRNPQNQNPNPPVASERLPDPKYNSNIPESGGDDYDERLPGRGRKLVYPSSESDDISVFRPQLSSPVDIFTRPDYGLVSPTSSGNTRPRPPSISTDAPQKLASSVNELSIALHKKFSNEPGNVMFSPLSISTALGMLYYGSGGITAEEIKRTLKYDVANLSEREVHQGFRQLMIMLSSSSNEYDLRMANALLAQKGSGIRPEYTSGLRYFYQAEVKEVDFVTESTKATRELNEWVRRKTNNKIDKLIESLDPATVLVILNAVYFKGTWQTQFNPADTGTFPFFGSGFLNPSSVVPMMMKVGQSHKFAFMEREGVKVLELSYKGEDVFMWIVLPIDADGSPVDGLSSLERRLSSDLLDRIRQNLVNTTLELVVIPKFKIEYSKELSQILNSMGMRSAFRNANLSGISDSSLFVSEVMHKATIEVNEEGSEAAAVTSVTVTRTGPNPSKSFIANYPFMFFIIDRRNGMTLFTGKVVDL